MKQLANGSPATWANWRRLAVEAFGESSPAVAYVDEKISEEGADTVVLAEEPALLGALATMHAMMEDKTRPPYPE